MNVWREDDVIRKELLKPIRNWIQSNRKKLDLKNIDLKISTIAFTNDFDEECLSNYFNQLSI
jgi:hypothetical protein